MATPQDSAPLWWPAAGTVALAGSSVVAGLLLGQRLVGPVRRLATLATLGPTKMAIVVQADLKMGRGKVAAQCCHGALAAYRQAQRRSPQLLQAWEDSGQPKVVLKASDAEEMQRLATEAESQGVLVVSIRDAGRTQVPSGSLTVVAIGPGRSPDVDKITGHLKLL
ncbi:peptidyl-tRNA hydrolase 2, mitochondrial-like [Eriocheir sinensis]|uniref:peptidyl-tRNA hydrolase 2, mitochondrial-like n=1 Tax=Eriocheir sinensis TaxID=95602 RepID=UPI0021CAC6FB|nr:peptidyl-tRNA hydrolase 2, mitochondrial-like [Eriocheir sinensis]